MHIHFWLSKFSIRFMGIAGINFRVLSIYHLERDSEPCYCKGNQTVNGTPQRRNGPNQSCKWALKQHKVDRLLIGSTSWTSFVLSQFIIIYVTSHIQILTRYLHKNFCIFEVVITFEI